MDPVLLTKALAGGEYAACVPADIYGQCADYRRIADLCEENGVPLVEDAAETLSASYPEEASGRIWCDGDPVLQREQDHHHQWGRGIGDERRGVSEDGTVADNPGPPLGTSLPAQ